MFLLFKITWFWNCVTWNCADSGRVYSSVQLFPISESTLLFFKVPRLRLFSLTVRTVCSWRWVCSMGEMILAGINLSTQRKTRSSATLSTAYLTWTWSGSNQGRRGVIRPLAARTRAPLLKTKFNVTIFDDFSLLRHCATSQNIAGSIPDGVIGIFHW
jgi:hypothetical protein